MNQTTPSHHPFVLLLLAKLAQQRIAIGVPASALLHGGPDLAPSQHVEYCAFRLLNGFGNLFAAL
jgi:hypothetical protein